MPPADASLHDAVSHLYQDHHGWLQGWLRRRLGCAENAADLAQDTFARLLASRRVPARGSSTPPGAWPTWLSSSTAWKTPEALRRRSGGLVGMPSL